MSRFESETQIKVELMLKRDKTGERNESKRLDGFVNFLFTIKELLRLTDIRLSHQKELVTRAFLLHRSELRAKLEVDDRWLSLL